MAQPFILRRSSFEKNAHRNFNGVAWSSASGTLTFPHSRLKEFPRSQKPTVFCGVWRVGRADQNPAIGSRNH